MYTRNFTAILFSWLFTCVLIVIGNVNAEQTFSVTQNITYNNAKQTLDIFVPKTQPKKTALMFIHGGGFNQGDKADMYEHAKQYAKLGFITSSINYRLSLSDPYPIAINDVTDALNWLKSQADLYQYNANKIILVGYSVGGTLALNVGLKPENDLAAIIDVAGITDINRLIHNGDIPQLKEQMRVYLDGKDPIIASPISQISPEAPPTLVLHGKNDGLIPIWQSITFVEAMKKQGAPVAFTVIYNAGHEIMLTDNYYYPKLLHSMTDFILQIETSNH
ncbi:MAG: alpha/beta hydrolase fold domain-containing protein [Methylotenera sp.]